MYCAYKGEVLCCAVGCRGQRICKPRATDTDGGWRMLKRQCVSPGVHREQLRLMLGHLSWPADRASTALLPAVGRQFLTGHLATILNFILCMTLRTCTLPRQLLHCVPHLSHVRLTCSPYQTQLCQA